MIGPLRLSFLGEEIEVMPDSRFAFGREADLVVDENPYLHRQLGRFEARSNVWWLTNTGSAISLEMSDRASPSKISVSPGGATPVPFRECVVTFRAGPTTYELEVVVPTEDDEFSLSSPDGGAATITAKAVPLNDEQRLLLVALAEKRLRDRSLPLSALPTNQEVTLALGWSTTKFNRKLDNLCAKFDRLGVDGLKGDVGSLAKGRRERLVDHVLTVGLIDESHLVLLGGGSK